MKRIFTFIILGAMTAALTGCPSKSSKSNNNYRGPMPGQGCINCGFQQATFSQSVSSTLPQGILTLSLVGDATQMNMWAANAQNPLFTYQGQIAVNGTLSLNTELYLGQCRLPVGNYSVSTLQSGLYNVGVFQIPAVQLTGPVSAVVTFAEGVILTDGYGSIAGFGAMMFGQMGVSAWSNQMLPNTMNMMPTLPTYPTGYNLNPQLQQVANMVSCGDMIGVRF